MKKRLIIFWGICFVAILLLGACQSRPQISDRSRTRVSEPERPEPEPPASGETAQMPEIFQGLLVTRPWEDITTSASAYYLTGCSDPSLPLYINNVEVENRGMYGSFGVYVELEEGENLFTVTQPGMEQLIRITQSDSEGEAATATTNILTRLSPDENDILTSGKEYTLTCVAPAGSTVSAEVGGVSYPMEQRSATALEGIPATYTVTITPPAAEKTIALGPVTYSLDWQDEATSYQSDGLLYLHDGISDLLVCATDVSTIVFEDSSTEDDYVTTLKRGAIDIVLDEENDRYLLGLGGWVRKTAVSPITESNLYHNEVEHAVYSSTEYGEELFWQGSSPAPYLAEWGSESLRLTFRHTTGLSLPDLIESNLFSTVEVKEEDGDTILSFYFRDNTGTRGYLVEYEQANTRITFFPARLPSQGSLPLEGFTILLDPGHGGADNGADGIARSEGPVEKEIALSTAYETMAYLQELGASVLLTRYEDKPLDLNSRLELIQQPEIDLAISLHCNSIPYNYDGTGASGTETYYYEDISLPLAQALQAAVCGATGRKDRGAVYGHYKMALNSNAPSVLLEMGFATNPEEYDLLCDADTMKTVAKAIGDAILTALGAETTV